MRKTDILKRKKRVDELNEIRELKIKEKEDREIKKEAEQEKDKAELEEGTEFNEEEFNAKFLESNPEIIVPEEVHYDIDNDYDNEEEVN